MHAQGLPAPAADLLARGRVFNSPCGDGLLRWHVWGLTGRPVVLLHGGSGSWTHWLRNIEPLLAQGRQVIVPDLPGFGDSALPALGRDADAMPAALEQGLNLLVGNTPCDLAGFSFGGMVGGLWARDVSARVAQLLLVAPPGLGQPVVLKPRAWRHLPDPAQQWAVHRHNLSALMFCQPASVTDLACRLQQLNAERDRLPGRRLARTDVLARALEQVRVPVHLVYGQQDCYYQGREAAIETVLRRCPGYAGSHVIADAGHWVQYEQPQAFAGVWEKVFPVPLD